MPVSAKHVLQQGPVLAAIGRTALAALEQRWGKPSGQAGPPATPGPWVNVDLAPRPDDLIDDYIRACGGDRSAYRKVVPAHLFPQWGFPVAAKTLADIPYPLARALNGGCRLQIDAPLPRGERLEVRGRLESVDDNGSRAVLHQHIVTGFAGEPNAVTSDLFAIVPLGGGKKKGRPAEKDPPKDKPRVPDQVRELARWRLTPRDGLDFAILTGDFNPIHWVPAVARASGFKHTILHGFATMARAIEGLNRGVWAGDAGRLAVFDCRFTRPLVLPAKVGLYIDGAGGVFVGDAPGGPAYLIGSYEERNA